jgi:hypothetical protein
MFCSEKEFSNFVCSFLFPSIFPFFHFLEFPVQVSPLFTLPQASLPANGPAFPSYLPILSPLVLAHLPPTHTGTHAHAHTHTHTHTHAHTHTRTRTHTHEGFCGSVAAPWFLSPWKQAFTGTTDRHSHYCGWCLSIHM